MVRRLRLLALAVSALFALGACSFVTGSVESDDGLSERRLRYLVQIGMIDEGEDVRFFTSGGLDFEEQGSLFTDVRVGSYWLPEGRPKEHRKEFILLKDVQSVEFTDLDSWTFADYLTVTPTTGKPLKVDLPGSDDAYKQRFTDALTEQVEAQR